MVKNQYEQIKVCFDCAYKDKRMLTKTTAAFKSLRTWNDPCPKCGCSENKSMGVAVPEIDEEIMHIWSQDLSLYLIEQDEDLWLAQEQNIEILLKYLDCEETLSEKREIVLSALCVLVFDNTAISGEYNPDIDVELGNRVAGELIKRKSLFQTLNTDLILPYIRKVVYPIIGLPV